MRILLLKTWKTNIGNAFIDAGAKGIIKQAFPNAEIVEFSGYHHLISNQIQLGRFSGAGKILGPVKETTGVQALKQSIKTRKQKQSGASSFVSLSEFVDVDLAVLPGCILYSHGLGNYIEALRNLRERNIPVFLLGAGGGNYQKDTRQTVKQYLDKIEISGLITRDSTAYDSYKTSVPQAHDGIDCAFFLDEVYDPKPANDSFITLTFDKITEPEIKSDQSVVRPDHEPFGEPFEGPIPSLLRDNKRFNEEGVFISDSMEDYLFIYSNTKETHSDRIHACIPTLVYGNKAKFYYETPRANLFEKIDRDINNNLIELDETRMEELKQNQIDSFLFMVKSSL